MTLLVGMVERTNFAVFSFDMFYRAIAEIVTLTDSLITFGGKFRPWGVFECSFHHGIDILTKLPSPPELDIFEKIQF